tara:strand:+ start:1581 stop:1739 length:159 start_codon:yes stop_codon:yes gene_type:complete
MAPTILGNANAILAIPNVPGSGSGPVTNFIILENGVDFMLTENGADLMIKEV